MLMEMPGQEPGNDFEILVVMRGQPAGVLLRGGRRAAGRRHVPRELDFAGEQHQERGFLARCEM
jgi:hypothetical protein